MYDKKSLKAEEFISHDEIIKTLDFAEENKDNLDLINKILEKARPVKTGNETNCAGLTHEEASVLLANDNPEITKKIFALAEEIKEAKREAELAKMEAEAAEAHEVEVIGAKSDDESAE